MHGSRLTVLLFAVAAVSMSPAVAGAQTPAPERIAAEAPLAAASRAALESGGPWVEKPTTRRPFVLPGRGLFVVDEPFAQTTRDSFGERRHSVARKVVGAAAGALGGFFAGGLIGAKLEPDCNCDDPGLKGFIIGAPVGAIAGAFAGVWLAAR